MATQRGSAAAVKGTGKYSGDIESLSSSVTRDYQVEYIDSSAVEMDAVNADGVPAWGAKLSTYNLYVMEKTAQRDASAEYLWIVSVTWRTPNPNKPQPHINATEPTWSVAKSIRGFPYEEALQFDINNKPCRNVLGEAFNPPITRVFYDAQINITFMSVASAHQFYISSCIGKVNADAGTITIGAVNYTTQAGEIYFHDYSVQETVDQDGNKVGQYALDILWRPGGDWKTRRPNLSMLKSVISSGTMTLAGDGTIKTTPILTNGTTGSSITEPRFLYPVSHPSLPGQPVINNGSVSQEIFTVNLTANFYTTLLKDLYAV